MKTQRKYKKTQRKYKKTHKKRRVLRNKSRKSMKGGNASMDDIIDMAKKNKTKKLLNGVREKFETHVNEAHICKNLNKIESEILSESKKNDSNPDIILKLNYVRDYIRDRYPEKNCNLPTSLPPSDVEDEDKPEFVDEVPSNVVVRDEGETQYLVPLEMEDGEPCQSYGLDGITQQGRCIPLDDEQCQFSDEEKGITRNGHCIPFEKNERPLTRRNAVRNPPQLYKRIVRDINNRRRTVNVDPRQREALYEEPITANGGTRKRTKRRS